MKISKREADTYQEIVRRLMASDLSGAQTLARSKAGAALLKTMREVSDAGGLPLVGAEGAEA